MTGLRHRLFARCATCHRDIARWEDRGGWWHLDAQIQIDHDASPAPRRGEAATERARILAEFRRNAASGNRYHLGADIAALIADELAHGDHLRALLAAVQSYDDVNGSDLPLTLLTEIRIALASSSATEPESAS